MGVDLDATAESVSGCRNRLFRVSDVKMAPFPIWPFKGSATILDFLSVETTTNVLESCAFVTVGTGRIPTRLIEREKAWRSQTVVL